MALEVLDLFDQLGLVLERDLVLRTLFLQQRQRLLGLAQFLAAVGAERDAPAERAAHRTHDAEVAGRAVIDEAGAVRLVLGDLGELRAREVGQREVVEERLHELFLGEVEDEVVLALAGVARLAAAAAATPAAVGPLDAVAGHVFAVARMHRLALAALAVSEHRLAQVALGDVDVFALFEVADAAAVDRAPHGLADLLFVSAQEALAVADRLVLAGQPSIDDLLQHVVTRLARWAPRLRPSRRSRDGLLSGRPFGQELLRTRRYHSQSKRTCFGV